MTSVQSITERVSIMRLSELRKFLPLRSLRPSRLLQLPISGSLLRPRTAWGRRRGLGPAPDGLVVDVEIRRFHPASLLGA